MGNTKKPMSAHLPATPCHPEMRDRLLGVAKEQGRSIADIQREAFSIFLSKFDTGSIGKNPNSINQEGNRD